MERQRTIVGNSRMLLALSQAALRDAPVGSSAVHVAYLEQECRNAAERLVESEHELERIQLYCKTTLCEWLVHNLHIFIVHWQHTHQEAQGPFRPLRISRHPGGPCRSPLD